MIQLPAINHSNLDETLQIFFSFFLRLKLQLVQIYEVFAVNKTWTMDEA